MLLGRFLGSGRPLEALKASKNVGGEAPYIFGWVESPQGPPRPQTPTPKNPARLPSGTQINIDTEGPRETGVRWYGWQFPDNIGLSFLRLRLERTRSRNSRVCFFDSDLMALLGRTYARILDFSFVFLGGSRPGIYFKAGSATTEGPGPDPQSTFTPNLLSLGIYFQRPAGKILEA